MLILVYGTLRKGSYNNTRFPMTYMKDVNLEGFKLYDLGPYPAAVHTGNKDDIIKTELYHVDANVKNRIDAMEIGAGYDVMTIQLQENIDGSDKVSADIYVFNETPSYGKLIEKGDYIEYVNQKDSINVS